MDDREKGFEGRGTTGGFGRPADDSATRSQTGHDTDGRSADYDVGGSGDVGAPADRDRTAERHLGDNRDGAGRDRTDAVTADETGTLISANKVIGTAVYDAEGERLGTIDSLMLNKRSGKVAFAVMSFGGFLGIGERFHPLPWDTLTYDESKGGYNVAHSVDQLREGPHYSRDELDQLDMTGRSRSIFDYYGINAAPYGF